MKTSADFRLDFVLDRKAQINEGDDGELYIEGFASDFGTDRDGEAFEDGAFQKSMDAFLRTNPVLLYHHKFDQALGQVVDFEHKPDGMWVKARVDPAEPGTILADVVNKIKRGTIRGFSVGGKFHRRRTPAGPRIHTADIIEISVTPTPVNPRTLFAVAGKAFGEDSEEDRKAAIEEQISQLSETLTDLEARIG